MEHLSSPPHRPAVVIAAHRRPAALHRLLQSLRRTEVDAPTPLIISIDGEAHPEVIRIAEAFEHPRFEVSVVQHPVRRGLTDHILWCLAQSEVHGAVILVEDDHYVAPGFYRAAVQMLETLGDHSRVAGISLYRYPRNEVAGLPFEPIDDGADVFYHRRVGTRGIALSRSQWERFRNALPSLPADLPALPAKIRRWHPNDWERQFNIYTAVEELYFAYPRISYVTNFGEPGAHVAVHEYHAFQSPLTPLSSPPRRIVPPEASRARYDHYAELEPACLQQWNPAFADFHPLTVDLYGEKPIPSDGWVLSLKGARTPNRQYELSLHPHELNAIFELPGTDLSLAPAHQFSSRGLSWKKRWLRHRFYHSVPSLTELAHYRRIEWMDRLRRLLGKK